MSEDRGKELPPGGVGEASAGQRWAAAVLQEPLLGLLRQAQRCLDATGSSLADVGPDNAAVDLPALLARISSVLMLLGVAVPSWQAMAPAQVARALLILELQLQDEGEALSVSLAAATGEQQSGYCSLMLRQAVRRLRLICSDQLGAAHEQLTSLPPQSEHKERTDVLAQTAEAVARLGLLNDLLPALFDSDAAGGQASQLSRLAILLLRRELKRLPVTDCMPVGPLLQQLRAALQDLEAGTESHELLVRDCLNYSEQRQVLLQDRLVEAGSRSELSRCFRQELASGLDRLRSEWLALSAKQGLRYVCGWHCAWVSRLTTAALICADVPRHDLLEAWRRLLCWQFECSEPLRQHDLQLFAEVCAALEPDVSGTEAHGSGMIVEAGVLEVRLAAVLCVCEMSTVVPGQVPVSLAQNIRALLTACTDIHACRDMPVSTLPGRRLLVELRLLTSGARALGVYRVEALSLALAEVHLMLARAGDMVLEPDRLELLAVAHSRLCSCLNCAAAHQEVPDCRELIATLYNWLDVGTTEVASRSRIEQMQATGIATGAEESDTACFQREAVGLVEAIDRRIAALAGPVATDSGIPACPQLLSLLHTLKGSARQFDCTAIADLCHGLEQRLLRMSGPKKSTERQVRPLSTELREYAIQLREEVDNLGRRQAVDSGTPVALPADDGHMLPIPAQALTRIAGLAEQLGHGSRAMLDVLSTIEASAINAARIGLLHDLLGEHERHSVRLAEEIAGSRTVSFDRVSARLQRLAARHANELNRQVWFQVQGGGLQLDRLLLERLVAPLEHLLRNAIDHGIEPVEERRRAGKPDCGSISLRVSGGGHTPQLQIELIDDGRGIGPDISGSGAESEKRMQRLFSVGFSTRARATALGGHGLGLAAVKNAIAALEGSIRVSSRPGAGTCFHIALPV